MRSLSLRSFPFQKIIVISLPAGSIDLKSSKGITTLDGSNTKWPFELVTSERVYYIEAESQESRTEWIEALEGTTALVKPKTELFVVSNSLFVIWE